MGFVAEYVGLRENQSHGGRVDAVDLHPNGEFVIVEAGELHVDTSGGKSCSNRKAQRRAR